MNLYQDVLERVKKAVDLIIEKNPQEEKLWRDLERVLSKPQRIIKVNITLKRDNETIEIFEGYRVQHNNFLGPYKGGLRFHSEVDENEIIGLAFLMTLKNSLVGLPLGGAKGGIVIDPKNLSEKELENLSREFVRKISDFIGYDKDIPAPDVNTNAKIMDWMVDEYSRISADNKQINADKKGPILATFTGKSLENGGSEGRESATGKGGEIVLKKFLEKISADTHRLQIDSHRYEKNYEKNFNNISVYPRLDPRQSATIAIQGFGNVGYNLAKFLYQSGFKIVALSDSKGGIYSEKGFNPELVMECKKEKGMIAGCYCVGSVCDSRLGKEITNEELLELDVDVLAPSAIENVINENNADKIKAKIILEMANGAITKEAEEILIKRGIKIIPDILANSGGVIVSYFEMLQNIKNEKWSREEVFEKLEDYLSKAVERILQKSIEYQTDLKTASYIVALENIFEKWKELFFSINPKD